MSSQVQLCTFLLADHVYGVDVTKVQEVLRYQHMTPVPLAPDTVRGLINLRGQIVTAIDLRRRLGLPEREGDSMPMNVVLRTEDGAISLLVDEISDVPTVDGDLLEDPPETMDENIKDVVSGVFKLDDHLLLLLDTERTIQIADTVGAANAEGN